jgi:hypothetical protein
MWWGYVSGCFVIAVIAVSGFYLARGHHGYTLCVGPGVSLVLVNPLLGEGDARRAAAHAGEHVAGFATGKVGCVEAFNHLPFISDAEESYAAEIDSYCADAIAELADATAPSTAIVQSGQNLWRAHGSAEMDSVQAGRTFERQCARRVRRYFQALDGAEEWLDHASRK